MRSLCFCVDKETSLCSQKADNKHALKNYKNVHGTIPQDMLRHFEVLKKCRNKFDCLLYEMLFIRTLKPNLNVQSDSIRRKVLL